MPYMVTDMNARQLIILKIACSSPYVMRMWFPYSDSQHITSRNATTDSEATEMHDLKKFGCSAI